MARTPSRRGVPTDEDGAEQAGLPSRRAADVTDGADVAIVLDHRHPAGRMTPTGTHGCRETGTYGRLGRPVPTPSLQS